MIEFSCDECPKCNRKDTGSVYEGPELVDYCFGCAHEWNRRKLIDPAEPKRLIEKAIKCFVPGPSWLYREEEQLKFRRSLILGCVQSYLSGDPEPLKKLARGEDDPTKHQ